MGSRVEAAADPYLRLQTHSCWAGDGLRMEGGGDGSRAKVDVDKAAAPSTTNSCSIELMVVSCCSNDCRGQDLVVADSSEYQTLSAPAPRRPPSSSNRQADDSGNGPDIVISLSITGQC